MNSVRTGLREYRPAYRRQTLVSFAIPSTTDVFPIKTTLVLSQSLYLNTFGNSHMFPPWLGAIWSAVVMEAS